MIEVHTRCYKLEVFLQERFAGPAPRGEGQRKHALLGLSVKSLPSHRLTDVADPLLMDGGLNLYPLR